MPSWQTYIQQPECGKPTMKLGWWWGGVGGGAEKGEDTFSKKKKKEKDICYFSTSQNILIAQKIKTGSILTSENITSNG